MKKLGLFLITLLLLAGCGGSSSVSDIATNLDFENTNFVTATTQVERRFLYVFNRGENNVAAYLIGGQEEGDGHGHAHGRILAQDAHGHGHGEGGEEEGFTELDGSPYTLSASTLVDMVVDPEGRYLLVLDQTGLLQTYSINGLTGLLTAIDQENTSVANPRILGRSTNGRDVAVLGDSLSVHEIAEDGMISAGSTRAATGTWTDVDLQGRNGIAATPTGVAGFQWAPGQAVFPFGELALPGATRGESTYAESGVWVVNTQNNSVSQLTQAANSELTLVNTFALPASVNAPRLLSSVFNGEDLGLADNDTFVLLHPEDGNLEAEAQVQLPRIPNRIFHIPESSSILLGHDADEGSTLLEIGAEEQIEIHEDPGPGHEAPFSFGFSERVETVTQTGTI